MNTRIGGPVKYVKDKEAMCLTKDQMRHVYKKVELEGIINVDTNKQEIEQDKLHRDNIDDEVNPYHNIIINNVDKKNMNTSQMEQWSILSNIVSSVWYDMNPKDCSELNVKALDQKNHRKMYNKLKDDKGQILEIDFGNNPEKLKREYQDMYEGV